MNFPNSECVSEAGDDGVCMTSGECLSRSGLVSGSCAQGFGACCLVYHDLCGGSLEYNNTYIRCDNINVTTKNIIMQESKVSRNLYRTILMSVEDHKNILKHLFNKVFEEVFCLSDF